MTVPAAVVDPDEILDAVLRLDDDVRLERYYGERSAFYNPGKLAPLGVIFASIKDHDGPNDRRSELWRDGVFRLALGITRATFVDLFSYQPARPTKGGVVSLAHFDPRRLNELTPHPVYAWMGWIQILSPSPESFEQLRPLVDEAMTLAKHRWNTRRTT